MDPKKSGKRMSVSFTASQAAALERASLATGATQASILAIALDDWLRRREATASEDSVPAMVRLVNEALGTHVGRHVVAEEIPYGDDGVALQVLAIDGGRGHRQHVWGLVVRVVPHPAARRGRRPRSRRPTPSPSWSFRP